MNHSWQELFLLIAMTTATDTVELKNENLLMTVPDGYKTDFQERTVDTLTSEMVPLEQSANNWTEMVRVQIFYGFRATPGKFKLEMDKARAQLCSGITSQVLKEGTENGYPALVWYYNCLLNSATDKPEFTWFKGIQGNDSFYLVQISLKAEPSEQLRIRWIDYLKKVSVCDTRLTDRPCPAKGPRISD
jgi:hypothetical protein